VSFSLLYSHFSKTINIIQNFFIFYFLYHINDFFITIQIKKIHYNTKLFSLYITSITFYQFTNSFFTILFISTRLPNITKLSQRKESTRQLSKLSPQPYTLIHHQTQRLLLMQLTKISHHP